MDRDYERLHALLRVAITSDEPADELLLADAVAELNTRLKMIQRFRNQIVEAARERNRHRSEWKPPPGFVGTKAILLNERFRKNGKNPPRMT
ncbi:MAG: hypothetical protein D6685_00700, partial [Bacteroidetes bacterium]